MKILLLDFETFSALDLKKVGSYRYAKHGTTKPILCSYRLLNGVDSTQVWQEGDIIPEVFFEADKFYAYNAVFDYLIANNSIFSTVPGIEDLANWVDVMALCGKYSYPLSLDRAAKALGTEVRKGDKKYLRYFCKPSKYSRQTHPELWEKFIEYARDDVNTMEEILYALPAKRLNERNQQLWQLTQRINFNGLPCDYDEVKMIDKVAEAYKKKRSEQLPVLTGNTVTKATQVIRIKKWCADHGVALEGVGAPILDELFNSGIKLPRNVTEVLRIRQDVGASSTKKFEAIMNMHYGGRVHMNVVMFGASTGRYAGRGFQLHNLPRAATDDPETLIETFRDNPDSMENPLKEAKKLIRSVIKAPEHMKLCVADWSGIETHLLFWMVNDKSVLELLRQREDLYKHMASALYGVPVAEVTKVQRQLGKVAILGCGYGMGAKRFQFTAGGFGIDLSLTGADSVVQTYRKRYRKVQRGWYELDEAARRAIGNPGFTIPALRVSFRHDGASLWITLPSGRRLHYPECRIDDGEIKYKSVDSVSKQWRDTKIYGGMFMENIIQAIAADILNDGLIRVDEDDSYEIIGHVHDEIITLISAIDEDWEQKQLEDMIEMMCTPPVWGANIPLFAEGYTSDRYRK